MRVFSEPPFDVDGRYRVSANEPSQTASDLFGVPSGERNKNERTKAKETEARGTKAKETEARGTKAKETERTDGEPIGDRTGRNRTRGPSRGSS
jgi:hypothetical protein